MREGSLSVLESNLGYRFENPDLLRHALTHSSANTDRLKSNERLEFLGDRVLGLIAADMLFKAFPKEREGDLGYRFTKLVRRQTLVEVAQVICLGNYIIMSDGERETGGPTKDSLLADTCEALIAAIYCDGGLVPARRIVEHFWTPHLSQDPHPIKDAKTALQEWSQANGNNLPKYQTIKQSGPDHKPVFCVEVRIGKSSSAEGKGYSKRSAEQAAAANLLAQMIQ